MYDINKRKTFTDPCTVKDFIKVLQQFNPNAQFLCDGDEWFWLHVEKDESVISIDSNSLDDEYEEEDD